MKTCFFVMLAIVIPVLAIFGCGEDEEDVIKLLKTDPPDGGDIDNLGKLTMTFDTKPIVVTIDSPGGSRNVKITGKTATYTFTTDDLLVPGGKVPIGISWASKGGSTGSKIVRLTIVAGGNEVDNPPKVDKFVGHWVNIDAGTRGITRVDIRVDADTIFFHMWGKCHPTDCDWGEETTSVSDADDGMLSLTWDHGFSIVNQTLSVLEGELLKVEGHTHFTDDSGRSDYDSTYLFSKE